MKTLAGAALFTTLLLLVLKIGGIFIFSAWWLLLPIGIYWVVWVTFVITIICSISAIVVKKAVDNEQPK